MYFMTGTKISYTHKLPAIVALENLAVSEATSNLAASARQFLRGTSNIGHVPKLDFFATRWISSIHWALVKVFVVVVVLSILCYLFVRTTSIQLSTPADYESDGGESESEKEVMKKSYTYEISMISVSEDAR